MALPSTGNFEARAWRECRTPALAIKRRRRYPCSVLAENRTQRVDDDFGTDQGAAKNPSQICVTPIR